MFFELKKDKLIELPIGVIHPNGYQPRTNFDTAELSGLCESIKRNGLLQPISVRRRSDGCYELIAGERRLKAARMAGFNKVQCILTDIDDRRAAILGLVENMQRQDLNPFEEAEAIHRLMTEWGATQLEIAQRLGKAQSTVANKLRLLRLSPDHRARIIAASLTERHARALLRIEDENARGDALNRMIADNMGSADAEKYVAELVESKQNQKTTIRVPIIGDVRIFVNTLSKAVESIRKSGLDAKSEQTETEDYIEYTVIIPKNYML